MHDLTMQAIEYALDGLSLRSEVIGNNVANSELPGFRPSRVSFEDQLASALRRGDIDNSTPGPMVAATPGVTNGVNEVTLEDEMVAMIKTGLQRDAMVSAYNFKTGQLRTAIRGVVA